MTIQSTPKRHDHLTFKGNLKHTRYGWLRLTPAYSIHLVAELLDSYIGPDTIVLDPFCGTGTTALVCAERGIACDTTDINPFLLWLCEAKTSTYTPNDLAVFADARAAVGKAIQAEMTQALWVPPIHQIEKWWNESTITALARAMEQINDYAHQLPEPVVNLLKIAFCRTMIDQSNASFGHQSMSFKKGAHTAPLFDDDLAMLLGSWEHSAATIASAAQSPLSGHPRVTLCDARNLTSVLPLEQYSCVITSPPYPNRMSYIRELRPYMYWLGYIKDARAAGELDWQAIGGTWGIATSNVAKWEPETRRDIPFDQFRDVLAGISSHSIVLSRYVHKYFYDMVQHVEEVFQVVRPGGTIHYIVGNSKFYDVLLPVEHIFAGLFTAAGFQEVTIRTLRKRTSKKELFEYVVSARKPSW